MSAPVTSTVPTIARRHPFLGVRLIALTLSAAVLVYAMTTRRRLDADASLGRALVVSAAASEAVPFRNTTACRTAFAKERLGLLRIHAGAFNPGGDGLAASLRIHTHASGDQPGRFAPYDRIVTVLGWAWVTVPAGFVVIDGCGPVPLTVDVGVCEMETVTCGE